MMYKLILIILSAAHVGRAHAGPPACRPVDLRPALGKARHQGASGWCFAHTTADLITLKTGVRASAFDVATTFLLSDPRDVYASPDPGVRGYLAAHPEFAARVRHEREDARAYGPERILKEDGLLDVGGVEELALVLANGRGVCADANLPGDDVRGEGYADHLRDVREYYRGLTPSDRRALAADFGYLGHIAAPAARARAGAFQRWVDRRCGARVRVPAIRPGQYYVAKDADGLESLGAVERERGRRGLERAIDAALDRERAVAIGFDANEVMIRDEGDSARHADHSSLVAARRESPRGCEYFVRNSFGEACDTYLEKTRARCEGGGLWVTLSELSTMYSAVWIE